MPRRSVPTFERRLLALDHDAFRSLVADLWRASGWAVSRDGTVIRVSREAETRRLLVLPPRRLFPGLRSIERPSAAVDAVVSPRRIGPDGRLPRGTPDVPIRDAADLWNRLLYGLAPADRRTLEQRYLGVEPAVDSPPGSAPPESPTATPPESSPETDPDRQSHRGGVAANESVGGSIGGSNGGSNGDSNGGSSGAWPLPAVEAPRPPQAGSLTAALLVAIAFLAVLGTTGVIVPSFANDTTGPGAAAVAPATEVHTTLESPVYDLDRTCEREPAEITAAVSAGLRGPDLDRSLVVLGEFWNPRHRRGIRGSDWTDTMTTESLLAYRHAEAVELGEGSVDPGESAQVEAVAFRNGTHSTYVFRFRYRTTQPFADCWVVDGFGPA